jgi:hypothetical protein
MRYFIHIITDQERLVDHEGAEFADLFEAAAPCRLAGRRNLQMTTALSC